MATVALKPTSYGVPVLAPTPGAVGRNQSGFFSYAGQTYRAVPARHGLLRHLAWDVVEAGAAATRCVLSVVPPAVTAEPVFPFELKAEYDLHLVPGGFRCSLAVENPAPRTQPLAVGWHPYLYRSGACTVHIPAESRWEIEGEKEPVPTGRILGVQGKDDFRRPRPVPLDEHWDDTFTRLPDGPVSCWTEEELPVLTKAGDSARARVRRIVRFTTARGAGSAMPLRHIQLYTPPGRSAICIEPLSAPPDAVNLHARGIEDADVCELAPGDRVRFEAEIVAEVTLL